MKEVARLRRDVGDVARPHRDRQQHDVHAGKAGDAEAERQAARFRGFFLLGAQRQEGVALIALRLERAQDLGRGERAFGPGHVQTAVGEVEPRLGDAGQMPHRAFDARDAGAAGDAFDREIDAERAGAFWLGVEREV